MSVLSKPQEEPTEVTCWGEV